MANNRMYLRCILCDARFYVAKYYPRTGWYTNISERTEDAVMYWYFDLQLYLERHSPCTKRDENGNISFRGKLFPHADLDAEQLQNLDVTMGETFTLGYE